MRREYTGAKIGKHLATARLVGDNNSLVSDLLDYLVRFEMLFFVHTHDLTSKRTLYVLTDEQDLLKSVRQLGGQAFYVPVGKYPVAKRRKKLGRRNRGGRR